jgi:hypothetical protein
MKTNPDLQRWLAANALFSGASGLAILVTSAGLPTLLGVGGRGLYLILGALLCLYAMRLGWVSRRAVDRLEGRLIVVGDVIWVLGSAALVVTGILTLTGAVIVSLVALVIAAFAVAQWREVRRMVRIVVPLAGITLGPGMAELGAQTLPGLPLVETLRVLPTRSVPIVDRMLEGLEQAYAAKDVDRFVSFFTGDFRQVDVNRRVDVSGSDAWRRQTVGINAAHEDMGRRHHGRALIGDWLVVELEWWGTVRGEALGHPGQDRSYRYSGLALIQLAGDRIRRQIIYADLATLQEQLGVR